MIYVTVPGTSANLGPGFDCLGIALTIYNQFSFTPIESGIEWDRCNTEYQNEQNLVYRGMKKTWETLGISPLGVRISIDEKIPISRGLGSSAACLVAGVVGANEMVGSPLSKEEVFHLASSLEGHPDNVAPAVFGGMMVSAKWEDRFVAQPISIASGLQFYGIVPDFQLSTEEARKVLPETIPYWDGVSSVGKTALLIAALANGEFSLLRNSLDDLLHQPYRSQLIPAFHNILEASKESGDYGAFLSGAGPTIMAIAPQNDNGYEKRMKEYLASEQKNWKIVSLMMDHQGVKVSKSKVGE